MRNATRYKSLALAAMLSLGLMTGCSPADVNTENTEDYKSAVVNYLETYEEMPESKLYQPYEHVFFKRYPLDNYSPDHITGGSIKIPPGYEIIKIENFNQHIGNGSETAGVDIWFTNTVPVLVEPVFNEYFGKFDYSMEGTVVDEVPVIEETSPSFTP